MSPNSHVSSFLAPTDSGTTEHGMFQHHVESFHSRFGVDMSAITLQSDRRRVSSLASPASELEPTAAPRFSTPLLKHETMPHSLRLSTVRRHAAPDVTVPHLRASYPPQSSTIPPPTLQDIVVSPAHALPPPVPLKSAVVKESLQAVTSVPTGCSLQSPFPLPALLDAAIPSYVLTTLHGYELAVAIVQDGHTLTYKRMTTLIRLGAAGLARSGLNKVCFPCMTPLLIISKLFLLLLSMSRVIPCAFTVATSRCFPWQSWPSLRLADVPLLVDTTMLSPHQTVLFRVCNTCLRTIAESSRKRLLYPLNSLVRCVL